MQIEIVAYAIILAVILSNVWGFLRVSSTADLKILQKYETWFPFSWLVRKKLYAIYGAKIEQCASEEEVVGIRSDLCSLGGHFFNLRLLAEAKYRTLKIAWVEKEIKYAAAANDEQVLIALLHKCSTRDAGGYAKLYEQVVEALRPFTEKRIKEAQTLEDLTLLAGVKKYLGTIFSNGDSRIISSLESLYVAKLKSLTLRDALSTKSAKSLCFLVETGDKIVDALVATKKNILDLPREVYSRNALLKGIDAALQEAAEHS